VRERGGKFILRIDDTDLERSTNEYEMGIKEDLGWLGLNWDATFNQSHKFPAYEAAAKKLREDGRLYACYETSEELDRQRKLQRVQGKPPVYNRAGLVLTDAQKADYEKEDRTPHWRFRLSGKTVHWTDMVRGEQSVDTSSLSDPVLIRGDGSFLYTLPSVVLTRRLPMSFAAKTMSPILARRLKSLKRCRITCLFSPIRHYSSGKMARRSPNA